MIVGILAIFATGTAIAYYSAKYHIYMDLLTRGAGFGYLSSTITSLIYAAFTFIFYALEGSIMAQAITFYTGIFTNIAYLVVGLVMIPLITYGMTLLNKLQHYTQYLWIIP
ncbi:MAG: hypothetical protein JZD40_00360 [Sulfolobus sp.]|nr:hypothetical protein [Sulfolobus sp.]